MPLQIMSDSCYLNKSIPFLKGEIIINDFREYFYMNVGYWSADDYKNQWQLGIEQIQTNERSCLITNYSGPKNKGLAWWPLYKQGDFVCIHNQIYVGKYYKRLVGRDVLTPDNCFHYVPDHRLHGQAEDAISAWKISLKDLCDFLAVK